MTSITNRWKLGAFVVSSVVLGLATLLWLGAQHLRQESETYYLFFDEDVSGLEKGSPVKFRGVPIGSVDTITIAEDNKAVMVTAKISPGDMRRMGLRRNDEDPGVLDGAARAQLVYSGITGSKFVLIDYFGANAETLEFSFDTPTTQTLLTVESTAKSMETVLDSLSDLPDLFAEIDDTLTNISDVATTINDQLQELELPALVQSVRTGIDDLNTGQLSSDFDTTLLEARELLAETRAILADFETQDRRSLREFLARANSLADGLQEALQATDVPSTARAVREASEAVTGLAAEDGQVLGAARDASALIDALQGSTRSLEQTLDAIASLARLLERDPRALLSGRQQTSPPARAP